MLLATRPQPACLYKHRLERTPQTSTAASNSNHPYPYLKYQFFKPAFFWFLDKIFLFFLKTESLKRYHIRTLCVISFRIKIDIYNNKYAESLSYYQVIKPNDKCEGHLYFKKPIKTWQSKQGVTQGMTLSHAFQTTHIGCFEDFHKIQ